MSKETDWAIAFIEFKTSKSLRSKLVEQELAGSLLVTYQARNWLIVNQKALLESNHQIESCFRLNVKQRSVAANLAKEFS